MNGNAVRSQLYLYTFGETGEDPSVSSCNTFILKTRTQQSTIMESNYGNFLTVFVQV
jgi:hypothetical protein